VNPATDGHLLPPTPSLDTDGEHDRGLFGYDRPATEARFRAWQADHHLDVVRVGMLALLVAGGFLIAAGTLLDPTFARGFWVPVVVSAPGFVLAVAATWHPVLRPRLRPIVATVVSVWGLATIWGAHRGLHAPELGTLGVVLVMMFGVQVFRVPVRSLVVVMVTTSALHLRLLTDAPAEVAGGAVAHVSIVLAVGVAGLLVAHVNERGERLRFEQAEVIEAQTRVIEAQQRHSDALLRRILPSPVVDRLRAGTTRVVDHHEAVTVLFADLVGFTPMTAAVPPGEVVAFLEDVFGWIDELAARHGVEKIKTIGDAYMAAVGVPEPRADHAAAMAAFALDLRDGLGALATRMAHDVQMRMGMATGAVVAGIIGRSRFAYDLWSDTVNTAARVQSLAGPGEILVDPATARALAVGHRLAPRGPVEVRGKGTMTPWLLDGRRAETIDHVTG
jgi:class 3 adenylate cyclase